jgi:hypothetical protein
MSINTDQALLEAQRELQTAQQAELQRVALEAAQQRRIADAQAKIRALEVQRWAEEITAQSQPYHAAITEMRGAWRDITTALERLDLAAAEPKVKPLFAAYDLAVKTAVTVNNMIREKQDPVWRATYLDNGGPAMEYGDSSDGDPVTLARAKQAADLAIAPLRGLVLDTPELRGTTLEGPFEGLIRWVTAIPEGYERQRRRGLVYALTGWFADPGMDSVFAGRVVTRHLP